MPVKSKSDAVKTSPRLDPHSNLIPLDGSSTPQWLTEAIKSIPQGTSRPPSWTTSDISTICIDDRRLNADQLQRIVQALQLSTLSSPHPLISAVSEHIDRSATDRFAWDLFKNWLDVGAPQKDRWTIAAVGLLGNDQCALKMTSHIKSWTAETKQSLANLALEALKKIGSQAALSQLTILSRHSSKALRDRAEKSLQDIADELGLTREELDDRFIPDFGLLDHGTRLFDYGFSLDPELQPVLKLAAGSLKTEAGDDDAANLEQAKQQWKLLKPQIKEVAKTQAQRFEHAMVMGRKWKKEEFDRYFIQHPLMGLLAKRLIWIGYEANGQPATTFRVTEEQSYANKDNGSVSLEQISQVGIVHPALLTEEDRTAWEQVLSKHDISAPFQQLARPIMRITADEREAKEITRFKDLPLPTKVIIDALESSGWTRGQAAYQGTRFNEHSKYFVGFNITAVISYGDGGIYSSPDYNAPVQSCFFVAGKCAPQHAHTSVAALLLNDVNPVVVSEVLGQLTALTANGKQA